VFIKPKQLFQRSGLSVFFISYLDFNRVLRRSYVMNVVTMKGEVPLRSLEKTGKRVMNHLPWLIELMRKRAKTDEEICTTYPL